MASGVTHLRPGPGPREGEDSDVSCVLFVLFLRFITAVCMPQGHLPSKVRGRQCGSVRRQCVQRGAELRGGRRSPAEVPARHAGRLELGSPRQALRSQLLVCRLELGGEGHVVFSFGVREVCPCPTSCCTGWAHQCPSDVWGSAEGCPFRVSAIRALRPSLVTQLTLSGRPGSEY